MPDRKPRNARRKIVAVDDGLLRRAGKILRTRSDADTVAAALDLIVFRDEVSRGIRAMAGSNSIRDIYADEA